ncbi:MAG: hypothetical protein JWM82_4528 [Myxococcales bacterium]|nr:hypothetical protein [Myxococcales bacterium]
MSIAHRRLALALPFAVTALMTGSAQAVMKKANLHKVADKSAAAKASYRGRSGGLDIFKVRAVMNADGSTDLYVEDSLDPNYLPAGDLSSLPTIKKVQLKISDETGKKVSTENIKMNGAAQIFHRTDLKRHWTIDAQATVDNVTYTGSPRTYVLNDSTTVLRRPDLAIVGVATAPTQLWGTTTNVTITVKEVGGDLPADGVCQADLSIPLAAASLGSSYAVGFSAAPGQAIDCVVPITWQAIGSWNWTARVLSAAAPGLFYAERNTANDAVTLPVTVTGPSGLKKQGFALASGYAFVATNAGTYNHTESQYINWPQYSYYFETATTVYSAADNYNISIGTNGQTIGQWIPYPITFSYAEHDGSGALMASTTGSSSGPTSTSTDVEWMYDPATNGYYLATETLANDVLFDDAVSAYFQIQGHTLVRNDTGAVVWNYSSVYAGRSFGRESSFNMSTYAQRTDPNAPLDVVQVLTDSSYNQMGGTPPTLSGSYRVTLTMTDGAGSPYLADSFVQIDPQTSTSSSSGCFNLFNDSPDGYTAGFSSCTSYFTTYTYGIGGASY